MSTLKGILKQLKRGKDRPQNEQLHEKEYSSEEADWPYNVVTAPVLHKPTKSCPGAPYGEASRSVFGGSATSTPRTSAQYPMYGGSVYELKTESSETLQAYNARHEIVKLRTRCRYHKEMASNYKEENDRLRNAMHQLTRRFEQLQEENTKLRETVNASGAGEAMMNPWTFSPVVPRDACSSNRGGAASFRPSGLPPLSLDDDTESEDVIDFRQRYQSTDDSFEHPRCELSPRSASLDSISVVEISVLSSDSIRPLHRSL